MPHPRDPESVSPVEVRQAKAASGVLVHAPRDRAFAASTWLLAAAQDASQAQAAWRERDGIALLRCGGLFGAVRISADLVRAAAATENTREVDGFLAEALPGAPVFMDQYAQRYYVLVPVSTGRRPEWLASRRPLRAEFLGRGCFLGVPRPDVTEPESTRCYWCVPMDGPGTLAVPDAVSQLVSVGRSRLATADGTGSIPPSAFRA
ncbi:hypothetical protein [Streptomyces sp. 11x1]|uniref:hypothetical protein n=1 Tax=Streptomyces sp. 11x1 TaxID=3038642 RepID=UPI00292E0A93|nr:hypothetical protein [Streptomyces sp. 11x1]WNZ14952.1 hypothetical protein P8T65_46800 [Streptomyces sp. 11x1]